MSEQCQAPQSLDTVEPGKSCVVVKVAGGGALRKRVLDMGIVPGTTLRVERKAPLADPVAVWFRGYELSLRLDEARVVLVRVTGSGCSCCAGCGGR